MEFLERLKDIVINFSKLTSEEKFLLKGWIKNTTNSNEIVNMNELVENILNNNDSEVVEKMVSNASKIFIKLKSDAIKEGLAEGRKEGIKEGIKDGLKKGINEGKADLLIKQLIKRFNSLSDYYIEKIQDLPEETIDLIATDIFDLEKIEDLKKYV